MLCRSLKFSSAECTTVSANLTGALDSKALAGVTSKEMPVGLTNLPDKSNKLSRGSPRPGPKWLVEQTGYLAMVAPCSAQRRSNVGSVSNVLPGNLPRKLLSGVLVRVCLGNDLSSCLDMSGR